MEHKELTEKIIGCAYKVYNKLGFGFLESVYENCMAIELENSGLHFETQKPLKVLYENKVVGNFISDIVVDDLVIVELKSVKNISTAHEVQLVNYLVATGKPVGLLINFGEDNVEVKRKIKNIKSQ